MADVTLSIGGRAYKLSCGNGEEAALRAAGQYLDSKSADLVSALGALSEARLLLMAALQVTSELLDERKGFTPRLQASGSEDDWAGLEALVLRSEALASTLSRIAAVGQTP